MSTATVWDFENSHDGGWAFYAAGGSSNHIERSIEFRSGYLAAKRQAGDTSCRRSWVAEIQCCPDCGRNALAHVDESLDEVHGRALDEHKLFKYCASGGHMLRACLTCA